MKKLALILLTLVTVTTSACVVGEDDSKPPTIGGDGWDEDDWGDDDWGDDDWGDDDWGDDDGDDDDGGTGGSSTCSVTQNQNGITCVDGACTCYYNGNAVDTCTASDPATACSNGNCCGF